LNGERALGPEGLALVEPTKIRTAPVAMPDGARRDRSRSTRENLIPESSGDAVLQAPAPKLEIDVRVTDRAGLLLREAVVSAAPVSTAAFDQAAAALGRTDDQGRAHLTLPAHHTIEVVARHPAYLPGVVQLSSDNRPTMSIDLVLDAGNTITGRVEDLEGRGVEGVVVIGLGPRSGGVWRKPLQRAYPSNWLPDRVETKTDGLGRFTLRGLRATKYFVTATGAGLLPSVLPQEASPQLRDPGDDIVLRMLRSFRVLAQFVDSSTGNPVPVSELDFGTPTFGGVAAGVMEPGGEGEQVAGDSAAAVPVGTFARTYQARGPIPQEPPPLRARVRSIRFRECDVELPLLPVGSQATTGVPVRVMLTPREVRGTALRVGIPDQPAATMVGRCNLLLRRPGERRWGRVVIDFGRDGGNVVALEPGTYEWTTDAPLSVVTEPLQIEVQEGSIADLRLDVRSADIAVVSLTITDDGTGVPLRDLFWRLQTVRDYEAGEPTAKIRGYLSGDAAAGDQVSRLGCVPAGDYVLVLNKNGYQPVELRLTLTGGDRREVAARMIAK
jgi:hypothetical protein